jgi:hypothetical protein
MSFVDDVRRLSQEEGLFDHEIAKQLNTYRVKVTRCRQKHNIPRPNLANRKDKPHRCKRCKEVRLIRRRERAQGYCPECREIAHRELLERKRKYMRKYISQKKAGESK